MSTMMIFGLLGSLLKIYVAAGLWEPRNHHSVAMKEWVEWLVLDVCFR